MKVQLCENERAVLQAAQQGPPAAELLAHARDCQVCREILSVTTALQSAGWNLDQSLFPPDPVVVWQRVQQSARQKAIAKATLPIRMAVACAGGITVVCLPWLLGFIKETVFKFPILRSNTPINPDWITTLSGTTGVALTASLICIALSSWLLARQE